MAGHDSEFGVTSLDGGGLAEAVRAQARKLPEDDGRRLEDSADLLAQPCTSLHRVHARARLVRSLYARLETAFGLRPQLLLEPSLGASPRGPG